MFLFALDGAAAMNNALIVLTCGASDEPASRLTKLAHMVGVETTSIDARWAKSKEIRARADLLNCDCLAASSESLKNLSQNDPDREHALQFLFAGFKFLLLYGFKAGSPEDQAVLRKLKLGEALSLAKITAGPQKVSFAKQLPQDCKQLRGLSFVASYPDQNGHAFELDPSNGDLNPLIFVGQKPVLVRVERVGGQVFLLSGSSIIDVDESVDRDELRPESYLNLVPWLVFLRSSFRDYCWHNPQPRALWIIDDPLLKPRYGFLQYRDLLAATEDVAAFATIAFIPWNHRRSNRATVELFKKHPQRLSLCVHGSDHTGGEFESGSKAALRIKARTALARMSAHQFETGLSFDRVMIFPQGGFCKAALGALSAENFLAAINTSVFASDWQPGDLRFRHLLDVASGLQEGVPLFSRRYPRDLFPLAFDLFMGKPALIAQHHDDFRHGYEHINDFAHRLSQQEEGLLWASPSKIVCESGLWKREGPTQQRIRFYTNDFFFRNTADTVMTYQLQKQVPANAEVGSLQWAGTRRDFSVQDSVLSTELRLNPGETAQIHVALKKQEPVSAIPDKPMYRARVASRRLLSEFRDNYIARNEWLLAQVKMRMQQLKHNR